MFFFCRLFYISVMYLMNVGTHQAFSFHIKLNTGINLKKIELGKVRFMSAIFTLAYDTQNITLQMIPHLSKSL